MAYFNNKAGLKNSKQGIIIEKLHKPAVKMYIFNWVVGVQATQITVIIILPRL